ncbi:hypothetical protein ACFLS7_07130 [Bacteroidota bacterium]
MKAIVLIFSLSVFQITSLFGGTVGEPETGIAAAEVNCVECAFLTPSIPMQASYEDQQEVTTLMEEDFLVPDIPMEADFTDGSSAISSDTSDLSPDVPQEADYTAAL